ncbi:MAG TPA: caspase family protein [Blastocatellia bacterium]|nr:caspase family protein [Blastocatellia bacterium]
MLRLFVIVTALALTARAQQPAQSPKTWAVVVGVSKYQKLPGGQQLQFADRDAALFAEAIEKRGVSAQNVRLITGAEATAAAIKSAIGNWLARSASESDTAIIFFSGHGFIEREFGESYLLGYDGDPKDSYGTALSVSELGQALSRRVRAGRVLVIADAVRRDFFDPDTDSSSARFFEQAFEQLTVSRPGMSAIIGSGPGEFSREGQRWGGHGAFTKHLADVLIDGADTSGNVIATTDDLFDLLKARLAEDTSNKQHPWRSGISLAQIGVARERPPVSTTSDHQPSGTAAPKPVAESKPPESKAPEPKSAEPKEHDVSRAVAEQKPAAPLVTNQPKVNPATTSKKADAPAASVARESKAETSPKDNGGKPSGPISSTVKPPVKPAETPIAAGPKPVPTPAKSSSPRGVTPPASGSISATQPATTANRESIPAEVTTSAIPPPPKPSVNPPNIAAVSSERANAQPETLWVSVPVSRPEGAPSPLVLQVEAAIASKNLLEPKNASAWDIYSRLASDPGAAADAARLKPLLAEALVNQGRLIVSGDVRSDNISDKVDEFKRAGQMLVRARALAPDNGNLAALEKLSASEALISLQFYDEAERALTQLQSAKLASVENALGLVYQGKLDAFRAERAFKRAIELDGKWASPHYNLALLYRGQQNADSLSELEAAAALDDKNVNLVAALGDEHFTRQQWKQAAESFRKAIALKPSDDALHTKLGHSLYSQGLQDEANREYRRASELRARQP